MEVIGLEALAQLSSRSISASAAVKGQYTTIFNKRNSRQQQHSNNQNNNAFNLSVISLVD